MTTIVPSPSTTLIKSVEHVDDLACSSSSAEGAVEPRVLERDRRKLRKPLEQRRPPRVERRSLVTQTRARRRLAPRAQRHADAALRARRTPGGGGARCCSRRRRRLTAQQNLAGGALRVHDRGPTSLEDARPTAGGVIPRPDRRVEIASGVPTRPRALSSIVARMLSTSIRSSRAIVVSCSAASSVLRAASSLEVERRTKRHRRLVREGAKRLEPLRARAAAGRSDRRPRESRSATPSRSTSGTSSQWCDQAQRAGAVALRAIVRPASVRAVATSLSIR